MLIKFYSLWKKEWKWQVSLRHFLRYTTLPSDPNHHFNDASMGYFRICLVLLLHSETNPTVKLFIPSTEATREPTLL